MRYAVDGYGVLSWVIGGMIDKMCISLISKVYRAGQSGRSGIKIGPWSSPSIFP